MAPEKQLAINFGDSAGHSGIVESLGSGKSLLLPELSFLAIRQ